MEITDVGLAKICRRHNIPCPGRGYWARLAAGVEDPRPALPEGVAPDEPIVLRHVDEPLHREPPPKPPEVRIFKTLRHAHEAVVALGIALETANEDKNGRLVLAGVPEPTLAVTPAAHRRALLLLDALAKAITTRGHAVRVIPSDGTASDCTALSCNIAEEEIVLSMVEDLDRIDHVPTKAEEERLARGYGYGIPKYDYVPQGRLRITLTQSGLHRSSWRDGKKQRLDRLLGRIVLAAEAEAQRRQHARAAQERKRQEDLCRQREEEAARRRAEEEKARLRHKQLLVDDLMDMARRWTEARQLRSFLGAVRESVREHEGGADLISWLDWATTWVNEIDPLTHPELIPKSLDRPCGDEPD